MSPPKTTAGQNWSELTASADHQEREGTMKRSKFSEEQVASSLRQVEGSTPVGDVCRQLGVSEATFYAWKKKYAHLGVSELRRLRQLEDEKRAVEASGRRSHARQAHAVRGAAKKRVKPARRRALAGWFHVTFQ